MASSPREVPAATRASFAKWYASEGKGLQRIALLKSIENATADAYEEEHIATQSDLSLRQQMKAVVLQSNMAGLEEFGEVWFKCIQAKMVRMTMCADWIVCAMLGDPAGGEETGFNTFERAFIVGAARILPAYNQYYLDYLAAVQDKEVAPALKEKPPPTSREDLYSSYTVVRLDADGNFTAVPFASFYTSAMAPVLAAFDSWIQSCRDAHGAMGSSTVGTWDAAARESYIAFLEQYRLCLASEADPPTLEALNTELDRKWMDTKMPIQLIHDIETGYGDPLRVKATPDMSLRFLDETYASENATIADIQKRIMAYYTKRDTPLSRRGLTALSNTMAGIYFIPFKTGMSLQFSFSGQSIPNRENVKEEKGVKIYFDAIETAARVEINKNLVRKVYHDAETVISTFKPDAVEQLVWHVAAHEVGHAIYNLSGVADCFSSPSYESMLEEPRAELTAMFTLRLLYQQEVLDRAKLDESLVHFALDGLRYFDKYDSEALRPYIIFQVYAYKVYHRHGYLSLHDSDGMVRIDVTKTLDVLDEFVDCFERILAFMDASDGAGLEKILFEEMAPEDSFVRSVLAMVQMGSKPVPRPERGCSCHPSWSIPICGVCGVCDPISSRDVAGYTLQ